MDNKYAKRAKISESKLRQLVKHFAIDLTATDCAELCSLNRNTVNRFYNAIRERIAEYCIESSPVKGVFEVDESYFGPRRVRGNSGRGAGSKTIVFGLFKRDGKVQTEIVPDCKVATLLTIIRGHADIESVIHSDGWRGYDGIVDLGYEKHYRVNHGENEFSAGNGNHINGSESFWGFAKHRLAKFKGIPKDKFFLYLKETGFRFNYRNDNLYHLLLKLLRDKPLFQSSPYSIRKNSQNSMYQGASTCIHKFDEALKGFSGEYKKDSLRL